jgi:hypothetical protein
MCDTSRYFVADPWFAVTLSGGGMRPGTGSFAEGDVVGFSTTTPNWANAVGVRSSMGIRIDGAGIEDGMVAAPKGPWMLPTMVCVLEDHQDGEVELGWHAHVKTR